MSFEGKVAIVTGAANGFGLLAVWLLSDETAYISGSLHLIDGAVNA